MIFFFRDKITYGRMIKYLYQLTDALTFLHSQVKLL